jgi:hypothetical protein
MRSANWIDSGGLQPSSVFTGSLWRRLFDRAIGSGPDGRGRGFYLYLLKILIKKRRTVGGT